MKGVIFESAGAAPKVVDDLPVPEPSADQLLVKSLYTAINPVYVAVRLITLPARLDMAKGVSCMQAFADVVYLV
jgi:NADPH:quinone reductase-like Zn-dependent oxidoreductase